MSTDPKPEFFEARCPAIPCIDSMDYLGFSKREQAAISLKVPDSGNAGLDAMIRESIRLDFVKALLPKLLELTWGREEACEDNPNGALELADYMMDALRLEKEGK